MEKTNFTDRTFRVTGRELLVFGCYFLLIGLVIIATMGVEVLFGDPETWGVWVKVGRTGAFTAGALATGWLMWRLSKPSLVRWLDDDERNIPAEEDAGR